MNSLWNTNMKTLIQAAVVTLFAASAAQAQQAVQWKVSDGGNGHWYSVLVRPSALGWHEARQAAMAMGADLATVASSEEWQIVRGVASSPAAINQGHGPWLGGFQDASAPDYSEPAGGWRWVDGTSFSFSTWMQNEPSNSCQGTPENYLHVHGTPPVVYWNDIGESSTCPAAPVVAAVLEFSSDCNNDGIVDYGQCRDGSLPDYNGNNIPDCCESGTPCVVGNYPVQWRVEDGGNGHWYRFVPDLDSTWAAARIACDAIGGHLATLTYSQENGFVFNLVAQSSQAWSAGLYGPFIGATRRDLAAWQWITGEPFTFQAWGPGEPNNDSGGSGPEDRLAMLNHPTSTATWNDVTDSGCAGPSCQLRTNSGYVLEWSADCNDDGIVDYGQILLGQFADTNQDGIPDVCQIPTCHDADLYTNGVINGADLAALLSEWGPVTPATRADINHDGAVNGADLSYLLSFWGPCP